jgi:enoyl-CoA hydratase/carnithine racemase
MSTEILVESADHLCTITLNRPEKRNALTAAMVERILAALDEANADPTVRAVIVRANGPAFCAGLDLRVMEAERRQGAADLGPLEVVLHHLEASPHPTIAAVQGDAVAGGCELALHCDLRVASETARLSMPLARIGLAVPVPLTWKLVEIIGAARTYEMLFTGEALDARTALALNMVNRVVPPDDLDSATRALALQIARNAPLAVRAMKAAVRRISEHHKTVERADLEELGQQVRSSDDLKEGLAAQRERRVPTFHGR